MGDYKVLWSDRKRPIFGLPISFTKYELREEKLIIESGILSIKQEEIRLYRILDLTLHRTFFDIIFGVGTIHFCTADKSTPEFDVVKVKHSEKVKEMISNAVEQERERKGIAAREFIDGDI